MPNSPFDRPQAGAAAVALYRRLAGRGALSWAARGLGLLVLVAMGFLGVDYPAAFRALPGADPAFVIPAFVVFCGSILALMFGWILVASSLKLGYVRTWSYARVFLISWFVGLGLPRGVVPLARLAVVAADKRSVARGTVAIVADRLVQIGVAVVFLGVATFYLSAVSGQFLRWLVLGAAASLAAALLLALVIRLLPLAQQRLASYRRATSFVEELSAGILELRRVSASRLASILAVMFLAGLLNVTALFLSSRALEINMHYLAVMGAWAAVTLVVVLPISINGLGPREGILAAAVAGAGFDSESGVALGLVWFLMNSATRLAAGVAWLMPRAVLEEDSTLGGGRISR